jgi:Ca2+:H+ antiporter
VCSLSTPLDLAKCATALIIPAAYHASFASLPGNGHDKTNTDDDTKAGLLLISRGTSIILFLLYLAYLNFQLRTHPDLFRRRVPGEVEQEEVEEKKMNLPAAAFASVFTLSMMDVFLILVQSIGHRHRYFVLC